MSDVVSRNRLWPVGHFLAEVNLGNLCRGLVASTLPQERERALHMAILFTIVCIGAVVRFIGLGNVGLHGDEETMAMAATEILRSGQPILPSGMFYPRGLTELYLMAASMSLFGESEWAMRLPSALCGVALIPIAFCAGRRFLRPEWNLAFAATIALLPELIVYSQTARMYIFLLTGIAACMACLDQWERTGSFRWLIGAIVALTIAIELHALAVTTVLLFLLPGIAQGDARKLLMGAVAAALLMLIYVSIDSWVNAQYPVPPPEYAADLGPPAWNRGRAAQGFDLSFEVALWVAGCAVAFLAIHLARILTPLPAAIATVTLLFGMLVAQLLLHYHLAALMLLAAAIVAQRYGIRSIWRRMSLFLIGSATLALVHVSLLLATPGSIMKLIGTLVGEPSVWPYYKVMTFSYVAAALTLGATAYGFRELANRRLMPDYALFGLLGIWVPMFMIGAFLWNVPPRYTVASLLPLLLGAFAFAQHLSDRWLLPRMRHAALVAGAMAAVLIVNPVTLAKTVDAGYELHPDHKGAAEFVHSQQIGPDDVVIAEDVLQQTYYLGAVDYWLISRAHARRFVARIDGEIRDFYTATRVISSAAMLEELLAAPRKGRIFVIGSGENQSDKRKGMRGDMDPLLHSDRFEVVYRGRDGVTMVWRATAPPPPAAE